MRAAPTRSFVGLAEAANGGTPIPFFEKTSSVTVKTPAVLYVCEGFSDVLVPPSPKVQSRFVMLPVELSVKLTNNGAAPLVGDAVKPATGGVMALAVM